jgi:hypothetical protein
VLQHLPPGAEVLLVQLGALCLQPGGGGVAGPAAVPDVGSRAWIVEPACLEQNGPCQLTLSSGTSSSSISWSGTSCRLRVQAAGGSAAAGAAGQAAAAEVRLVAQQGSVVLLDQRVQLEPGFAAGGDLDPRSDSSAAGTYQQGASRGHEGGCCW